MNLLCPNCQKMLTVAEEFAGQLMKCPLCTGTFTVPALPALVSQAHEGTPNGSAPSDPGLPSDDTEVYGLQDPPPAPPSGTATDRDSFAPDHMTLDLPVSPPAGEEVFSPSRREPSLSAARGTSPAGSRDHGVYISLNPEILRWVAPGALLLIFLLQMFPWVGLSVGGSELASQSAWGAAFGSFRPEPALGTVLSLEEDSGPGWSVLTLFYLVPFTFLVIAVTIACALAGLFEDKVPPAVRPLLPWRWAIALGANLLLFLFLLGQLVVGFSLESMVTDAGAEAHSAKERLTPAAQEQRVMKRWILEDMPERTVWLRLVVLLHLVAIVACGLSFWLSRREPGSPPPRLAFYW